MSVAVRWTTLSDESTADERQIRPATPSARNSSTLDDTHNTTQANDLHELQRLRNKVATLEKELNLSNEIWATIEVNIIKLLKADAFLKTDGGLAIKYMSEMRKTYLESDTNTDDKPSDKVGTPVAELDDVAEAEKPGEEDDDSFEDDDDGEEGEEEDATNKVSQVPTSGVSPAAVCGGRRA